MADTEVKSYCPLCKVFEASRDGNYCSHCGGELIVAPPPRKCLECGHEVRLSDRHCKNCGAKLKID